jgi:hypothetical protein
VRAFLRYIQPTPASLVSLQRHNGTPFLEPAGAPAVGHAPAARGPAGAGAGTAEHSGPGGQFGSTVFSVYPH